MLSELLKQIEDATGFFAYEALTGASGQYTFYGTSDKYETFKTMAGNKLLTGTIVYLLDTGDSYMYSKYKNAWY